MWLMPAKHRGTLVLVPLLAFKEEDGREVETGFLSSDDAEESTITRYNATVAGLAHLCHCMNTPGFPLPRFHFSQLAQLPFEWPMGSDFTDQSSFCIEGCSSSAFRAHAATSSHSNQSHALVLQATSGSIFQEVGNQIISSFDNRNFRQTVARVFHYRFMW